MKLKNEYILRNVVGEYIIVPVSRTEDDFNGLITVNEIGKVLWEHMSKIDDFTVKYLVDKILEEYDVDIITANEDVREFVDKLIKCRVIEGE